MHRLLRHALRYLLPALLLGLALLHAGTAAAEGIEIRQAQIEATDEGFRLASSFSFELNRGLEDALMRGIPLYFTTDVDLTRPRWYWFDENTLSASQTLRLSYNVLTRQYHAGVLGSLQQTFPTLEDAMALIHRPNRWLVADKGALKSGAVYQVAVRMRLDVALLPKPFQVNALNNSDWRMSSDWKVFSYKVE
jgi:hypothetical protein